MSSTKQVKLFLRRDDIFSIPFEVDTPCGRKFEIEERLDRGGNGAVHRCVEATTGNEYAIKFLLKYDRSNKRLRRFNYERDQLKQLKHEHLIRFIAGGSISSKRTFNRTKSTKNVEFFIMDLADSGNLQGLSLQAKNIPEEIYKAQFRGLASGLRSLHQNDVVHRDIKPANILVSGDKWLLCDFGLCAPLSQTARDLTGDENLGPRHWMSPEMSNRSLGIKDFYSKIGKASDVFQMASVFWFIVNKRHPSGIIEESDWSGPSELFPVLKRALEHCPKRRTLDGGAFFEQLAEALNA